MVVSYILDQKIIIANKGMSRVLCANVQVSGGTQFAGAGY